MPPMTWSILFCCWMLVVGFFTGFGWALGAYLVGKIFK